MKARAVKVNHAGMSDIGLSACSQRPFWEDSNRGFFSDIPLDTLKPVEIADVFRYAVWPDDTACHVIQCVQTRLLRQTPFYVQSMRSAPLYSKKLEGSVVKCVIR